MTPLERRSLVRSDGRHTDTLLLSRLDRADSTSSLPLATDRDRPKTANVQLRTTEVNLKIRHDLNKRVCVCCTCNSGQRFGVDEAAAALARLGQIRVAAEFLLLGELERQRVKKIVTIITSSQSL